MNLFKTAAFAALGLFGFYGAFHLQAFQFLNGVNILFHEAGHLFFMPFGQYWHVWGGTLTQLLIPLGIAIAFWVKRQPCSAAVMLWWCGENFFGISAYIKDSRSQTLPFLGGEQHDWEYILNAHGLIMKDQQVGNIAWVLGILIMTAAVIAGIIAVSKEKSHAL